jgi:hypothetical protein
LICCADDRVKTSYHFPCLTNLLQLLSYGVFCERGELSSSLGGWALYVPPLLTRLARSDEEYLILAGLSGFTIFITVAGMCLSAFLLLVPVIYEKYDKFARLARVMKEVRVSFTLTGAGTAISLLIAYVYSQYSFSLSHPTDCESRFIVTISAWTEPGCKNPDKDPNADKGKDFKNGLSGWCSTKKAGAVFLWLAFGSSSILSFIFFAPHPGSRV